MQLTEKDRKVLEEARKLEKRWPKTRWIALAIAIGMISIAIVHWSSIPESSVLGGLGFGQLVLIFKVWNGRPMLNLLLKLAEENDKN